ncbi:BirA family transcriptional regulator, biotin operon repressor / biotin-[acetyl-CoA-carboxylase] ligase [Nitrosospira sp. Nsp11]|uniref:biotin--[acetyl-CoA-carboxylase] ligase n=1 Tax=Nitrosospira sp. Nsp11 TaxID=1855338 RepID=UPI0009242AFF|nr:biotin--[acetyl-CoA-carboxylase] ligase [Nitrosospira sp. Nsp11]SHL14490.1 BirA family transcriptional regulator, biotin operon repressor / biotin-[acetyl-CoA-carboxylase] ligase [Nitrosospira sp. Nsp11]
MKPLTFSILRLLSDNEFHSGATIAQTLGVSRASVSNALRDVDEAGLTVHRIHGRGYRLLDPVQWMEREVILKHLGRDANNFHLEVMDSIDSTNTFLLHEASRGINRGRAGIHVVAAELQTSGRGRRGRQWHSGLGGSLAFSMSWQFQQGASFLSGLSLAIGVAIIRTLESAGIKDAVLKWPNDVMYNLCKLAGILIELHGDMLGPSAAVIGVGVNLKLSDNIQARIDQGVTDVYSITGKMPDRNELLAALLIDLTAALREFERRGFAPFKEEWMSHHFCENKAVSLRFPDGSSQEGTVHGVADDGSLLLQTSAGIRSYSGGEITLCRIA